MKLFKWIVGGTALFIAGCAAYFSVTGIATLFSGSLLGVAIMATSLEIGKLVAASYLHRYWNNINLFFKTYFTIAVLALIGITSMGIFGFLSNAYQKTALEYQNVQAEVSILQRQIDGSSENLVIQRDRIETLSNQRASQETRYDSLVAGENWVNARRTYELIVSSDEEISKLTSNVIDIQQSIDSLETEILNIQRSNIDIAREIGGFQFIADAFGIDIDTAVKWFILILIFVFDPLAVSLVVAFNMIDQKQHRRITVPESEEITNNSAEIANDTKPEQIQKDLLGSISGVSQKKPNQKKPL